MSGLSVQFIMMFVSLKPAFVLKISKIFVLYVVHCDSECSIDQVLLNFGVGEIKENSLSGNEWFTQPVG